MQLSNQLNNRIEIKQHLALNADVLQSLKILRLSIQDLRELLVQKTYENPLLELDSISEEEALPVDEVVATDEQSHEETLEVEAAVQDIWAAGAAGSDVFLAVGAGEQSFEEMLNEQIGIMGLSKGFAALCRFLTACLDRRGYFTEPPEDIAHLLGCSVYDVMQALYVVQSLEPVGVGARSLEECLLLQLAQSPHFCRYTVRLIKCGRSLLAAGNIREVAALLEVDEHTAKEACRVVRNLNPIPSQGYDTGEQRQTVIPDASIEKTETGFLVVYNQRALPSLTLNADYIRMLPTLSDPDDQEYLRRNLNEAHRLIKAVKKRESTIMRIIGQIVKVQPRFFADGQTLVPMNMESLATELELNISTVSRALQGKYVKCAAGMVEIKSLFTTGVKGQQGELVSAILVKRIIKSLIDAEDGNRPQSDDNIRAALEAVDITVARRTVAKYREEMGIPSSVQRRR